MRITVISDTHIPVAAKTLPSVIWEEIKKSDICIHAGDWIDKDIFQKISSSKQVYGVYGNMDDFFLKKSLSSKEIIEIGKVTIALIHGYGSPKALFENIQREFADCYTKIQMFIFGHSHIPIDTTIEGKIYFNPGSPTDKLFAPYNSYGIVNIIGEKIERNIIKIG